MNNDGFKQVVNKENKYELPLSNIASELLTVRAFVELLRW